MFETFLFVLDFQSDLHCSMVHSYIFIYLYISVYYYVLEPSQYLQILHCVSIKKFTLFFEITFPTVNQFK